MKFKSKNVFKKHLTEQKIARYVDALAQDELSHLSRRILRHVEHCPGCKDQIMDVFLTLKNGALVKKTPIRTVTVPSLGTGSTRSYTRSVYRIAASFFILGCLVAFYFTVIDSTIFQKTDKPADRSPLSTQTASRDDRKQSDQSSAIQKDSQDVTAKQNAQITRNPNFEINPNLELMINSQFRNETITVLSPKNKSTHTGNINFSWKPFSPGPVQLKILNNKNEIIFQYTLNQNRFTLNEELSPGLYYWKLESFSDLLYVGKFFIKNGVTPREE